jgi:hypothetical protein
MPYLSLFNMPTPMKITGRSSTITNSFINSIIPTIAPTREQIKEALDILGMDHNSFQCSYCGAIASEWDHLRPLVMNKRPTGYISEIHNLVPACGKCNQSKGNKPWLTWIESNATLSPRSRGVKNLHQRIERLLAYEKWCNPTIVNFEAIVGKEKWEQHWANWEQVQTTMRQAQVLANEINLAVAKAYSQSQ